LALLAVIVLRGRKPEHAVDETALKEAMDPVPVASTSTSVDQPARQPRGPPGGQIGEAGATKPTRGPPRGPPRTSPHDVTLDTKAMAAAHFDALGPGPEATSDDTSHAADYTHLPGGGDYEYTDEGTFYVVPGHNERWRLNDDKSFTKVNL